MLRLDSQTGVVGLRSHQQLGHTGIEHLDVKSHPKDLRSEGQIGYCTMMTLNISIYSKAGVEQDQTVLKIKAKLVRVFTMCSFASHLGSFLSTPGQSRFDNPIVDG